MLLNRLDFKTVFAYFCEIFCTEQQCEAKSHKKNDNFTQSFIRNIWLLKKIIEAMNKINIIFYSSLNGKRVVKKLNTLMLKIY